MTTEEKSEEAKILTPVTANEYVNEAVKGIYAGIIDKLRQDNIHPKQQWIIMARIVNYVFQQHYSMAFVVAKDSVARREQVLQKEVEV